MAQIPRSLPPAFPTNVTSTRLQGPSRAAAGPDGAPIEAVDAQDGVLFNDALLFQDDEARNDGRRNNSQGGQLVEFSGSSQTFASIFEEGNATGPGGDIQKGRARGFANLIARAISTYETNVQVIQGTTDPRGSTLSLTL